MSRSDFPARLSAVRPSLETKNPIASRWRWGLSSHSTNSNLNRRAAGQQRVKRQSKVQIHNHAKQIPQDSQRVNPLFLAATSVRSASQDANGGLPPSASSPGRGSDCATTPAGRAGGVFAIPSLPFVCLPRPQIRIPPRASPIAAGPPRPGAGCFACRPTGS